MLIAAVAAGIASHLHLGVSLEVAAAVGISMFCLMLMCHVLLRVADEAERAADEAAESHIEQVSSPMPSIPVSAPTNAAQAELSPSTDTAITAPETPAAWGMRPVDLQREAALAMPSQKDGATAPPLPELGELRPSVEQHKLSAAAPTLSVDREADRIDAILKRLAQQIHEGAAVPREPELTPAASASAAPSPTPPPVPDKPIEELAAANPDTALASAVDALRSTVEAMRGSNTPPVEELSPAEIRVAAVADAIQAEQADVYLAPILGLTDQCAYHFEVSVQLRMDDGDVRDIAAGAGLLPLLDALTVRHSAAVASMLERRGRDGAVFSRIGGASLESDSFVSDVAGQQAQGLARRMVLSFVQGEMRGLGPAQLTALEDLGRLGFRFTLQGVADLDMDFEALKAVGFAFVKLDAAVFQGGLMCNGTIVPASDICEHFRDLGLDVIVGEIADAETRDRLLTWGVLYGQGQLFGPPRPVAVVPPREGTIAA